MLIRLRHWRLKKQKSHIYTYSLYLFVYCCFTDDINYKQKNGMSLCIVSEWFLLSAKIVQLYHDDDVRSVLDQYALLNLYKASSLKQQSADRHVIPLGHIILIQSQPVFALSLYCYIVSWEATHTNFIVNVWLELTIYHTRGEHVNHYATDAVSLCICHWYRNIYEYSNANYTTPSRGKIEKKS
jgi:hypothetical protein